MKIKNKIALLFAAVLTATASLHAAGQAAPAVAAPEPTLVWTPQLEAEVARLLAIEYARLDGIRTPWWARRSQTFLAAEDRNPFTRFN